MHCLSQATGGKYFGSVTMGQSSLCSRVLLLPLDAPPTPAPGCFRLSHSQDSDVGRVLTTTDVGVCVCGGGGGGVRLGTVGLSGQGAPHSIRRSASARTWSPTRACQTAVGLQRELLPAV